MQVVAHLPICPPTPSMRSAFPCVDLRTTRTTIAYSPAHAAELSSTRPSDEPSPRAPGETINERYERVGSGTRAHRVAAPETREDRRRERLDGGEPCIRRVARARHFDHRIDRTTQVRALASKVSTHSASLLLRNPRPRQSRADRFRRQGWVRSPTRAQPSRRARSAAVRARPRRAARLVNRCAGRVLANALLFPGSRAESSAVTRMTARARACRPCRNT